MSLFNKYDKTSFVVYMLHAVEEPVPSREWQRSVHSQNLHVNLQTAQTLYAVSRLCGI